MSNYIDTIVEEISSSEELMVVSPEAMHNFKRKLRNELAVLVQAASMDSAIVHDAFDIEVTN